MLQAFLPTYGCGRGSRSTRTLDFYCVILKSHFPMLPIRPFRAFLLDHCIFQGCKCPLSPIFPWRFFLIATLLQHPIGLLAQ
jgi:hypothetical protein